MNELSLLNSRRESSLLPFYSELRMIEKPKSLINRRGRMRLAAVMELNLHMYLPEEVKSFLDSFLEPGEGL